MSGDREPKNDRSSPLQPITDFEGKDEETTAQFWSAARLARSDPKLKAAIERLAAELGEPPPPSTGSLLPMDEDGLGGSLQQIYDQGRRESHDEIPHLPPLSSGRGPRENTQPLPETEDPTLAAEDEPPAPPRRTRPAPDGGYDEVRPETTDPNGLLGPVDEFTLSLAEDVVRKATEARRPEPAPARPAPPPPRAEPAPRPPPRPDPLTTGVVPRLDPLTTGVVALPDDARRPIGEGTAKLMFDGLDEEPAPAPRVDLPPPRPPARPPERPVRRALEPESLRLPDVPMPPPDTARARPLAAPDAAPDEGPVRAPPREPRPAAGRPPPPARPAARPEADPRRGETPPAAPPHPAAPPAAAKPAPVAPNTAAVKRLEELLTLAEEPPEKEETISSSMELLSLADAPPEKEDTIGADLVRIDRPAAAPAPRLPTFAEAPPEKEETLSRVMERIDEVSVDDVELLAPVQMPADVADDRRRTARPPPRPTASPPQRPAARADTAPVAPLPMPVAPAVAAAPPTAPVQRPEPDLATRPIERADAAAARTPAPPRTLQSAQLRRETWKPPGAAPAAQPVAAQAPPPRPPPAALEPSAPPAGQDSLLVWAGTIASFLIGGGMMMMLVLLFAWIV